MNKFYCNVVALLAVRHINDNTTLLRNYVLDLHLVDGRCKEDIVMQRFLDVYTNKKHKTYVGVLGKLVGLQIYYFYRSKIFKLKRMQNILSTMLNLDIYN